MKNILRIFKYDLKKIHKNVIAMIVIMGITVIPVSYTHLDVYKRQVRKHYRKCILVP